MPRFVSADYRAPGAGLANALRPHLVRPDEFSSIQNMWLRSGNLVKRGGSVQQGDAPDAAVQRWMGLAYDTAGSSIRNRLRYINGKIQYLSGASWTNLVTGLTATTYPVAVQYKDTIYWCDGTSTPQAITIASPPTIANWTTMPSGINPGWVVLHENRLYIGNDTSDPQQVWMCDPGTPATFQATEFYQVPDNQNGNFPKIAVNCGKGFLMLCQDFMVYLTGNGPLSHRLWHYPRGAACIAWRSAVDMGDFGVVYLTERGLFVTDGTSPPEPLDRSGKNNWGDINLTTETDTHGVRYGDVYVLFYRSKGDTAAAATQTARGRFSTVVAANSRYSQASSAAQTSHWIAYDCRLHQFVGMGTGAYSCAAWEQYRSGDTQDLWVGSATTNGETYKWDQAGTWQDDGAPIECIVKTGAVAPDTFQLYTVDEVQVKCQSVKSGECGLEVRVYFDGLSRESEAAWKKDVSIGSEGPQGADNSSLEPMRNLSGSVVRNVLPDMEDAHLKGTDPQVEIRQVSNTEFEFNGLSVKTTPAREE